MTIISKGGETCLVVKICSNREGEEKSTLRNVYLQNPISDSTNKGIIERRKSDIGRRYVFNLDAHLKKNEPINWKIMINDETLVDLNDKEYLELLKSFNSLRTQNVDDMILKKCKEETSLFWSTHFNIPVSGNEPTNNNFVNAQDGLWHTLKSEDVNNIPFTVSTYKLGDSSNEYKVVVIVISGYNDSGRPSVAYTLPIHFLLNKNIIIFDSSKQEYKFNKTLKLADIKTKLPIELLIQCLLYYKDDSTIYQGRYGKIKLDEGIACGRLKFSIIHFKLLKCFQGYTQSTSIPTSKKIKSTKPTHTSPIEPNKDMIKIMMKIPNYDETKTYPPERKLTFSKPAGIFPLKRGVLYMEKIKDKEDKDYLVFKQLVEKTDIDIEIKIPTKELLKGKLLVIGLSHGRSDEVLYYFTVGEETTDEDASALKQLFDSTIQVMITKKIILDATNNPITEYNTDFEIIKNKLIT